MKTILLQSTFDPSEISQLEKECPQYQVRTVMSGAEENLTKKDWSKVEILYSHRLQSEHLAQAGDLHWIHCPSPSLSFLCVDEIRERGNILITTASEENLRQIVEFIIGGILIFSKQLLHWSTKKAPEMFWQDEKRKDMWTLQNRTLLQIGLGKVGTEMAHQAKQVKLKVIGVQSQASFHQHCDRTVAMKDLSSVLPEADIVCVSFARGQMVDNLLSKAELERMKDDSILILLGPHTIVNAEELAAVAATGKFRGILFDVWHQPALPADSPLWSIPQLMLTPEVSFRPAVTTKQAYQLFHYNLRQFMYGNFKAMRNKVEI